MNMNVFRMPEWYPKLEKDCFPTVFLELDAEELEALKEGRLDRVYGMLPESWQGDLSKVAAAFAGKVDPELAAAVSASTSTKPSPR